MVYPELSAAIIEKNRYTPADEVIKEIKDRLESLRPTSVNIGGIDVVPLDVALNTVSKVKEDQDGQC